MFASRLHISRALLVLIAAGSLLACHKKAAEKPTTVLIKKSPAELKQLADAANEGLEGLKPLLATQTEKFRALHGQFDGLPRDMPNFEPIREKFASADEGLGRMNAKIPWLKHRLDDALNSGDGAELEEIQQSIAASYKEVPEVNQIATELMHEVLPFTRMAEQFEASKRSVCDSDKVGPEAVSKRLP